MLRYIFMGTPEFAATILREFAEKKGPPQHVFTQPPRGVGRGQKLTPSAVQNLCAQQSWPCTPTEDVNATSVIELVQSLKPEVILVAAFGQLLKKPLLSGAQKYCLNVHASLLPKYRGAAPIQRAILEGESETGITIQKMARKLDTGDILLQRTLSILPKETSSALHERLSHLGAACLVDAVSAIQEGKEHFRPQEESQATYAGKLSKDDAKLDWKQSATALQRRIYGLQPWPIAETRLGKDRLQIYGADCLPDTLPAGAIATDSKTFLRVGCGSGSLALTEIQLENRKRLSVVDFLKGYRGNFPFTQVGDEID